MKVELISRDDISEGLVYDLVRDGAFVYYKGRNRYVFNDIENVEKVSNYVNADYYIFDDTMFGLQIENMRGKGKYVVGGSKLGDKLELDRAFFFEKMKKWGVNVPDSYEFHKISDGIKWLENHDGKWVFKPSGKLSDEKNLTYVGDDVKEFMEDLKSEIGDRHDYVLQKFIEGSEVAITGLVVDGKVVGGYFINFEYKPFMKFSTLNTGEMGTVVTYMEDAGVLSEYFNIVAGKLQNYRGWFDLNGIYTSDGEYYVLEPTSRMGIPIMSILHSMLGENIAEFYYGVAKGNIEDYDVREGWFVGIVLAIPPFPYHIPNMWDMSQKPIVKGLFDDRNVHYYEIMKKDGEYWTSGDSGFVAVVVGEGESPKIANLDAVRKCRLISIPDNFFRFDVGLDERWKVIEKFK